MNAKKLRRGAVMMALTSMLAIGSLGGAASFAATSSSSNSSSNSSYNTNTGSITEALDYSMLTFDLFDTESSQGYNASTGRSYSDFRLDASNGFEGSLDYNRTMTWRVTNGTESESESMRQSSGWGYSNHRANEAYARADSLSEGSASVSIERNVRSLESIEVEQSQSNAPNGSNSSRSSISTANINEVSGSNSSSVTWNNQSSSENSQSSSSSNTRVNFPGFDWDDDDFDWNGNL